VVNPAIMVQCRKSQRRIIADINQARMLGLGGGLHSSSGTKFYLFNKIQFFLVLN